MKYLNKIIADNKDSILVYLFILALVGGLNTFIIMRVFSNLPLAVAIYPATLLIIFALLIEMFARKNLIIQIKKVGDEALRTSEERFTSLVDHIENYAICTLDSKGFITSWNEGGIRITGYESGEVIGKHISLFFQKDDIDKHKPNSMLQIAALEGSVEDLSWKIKKDGSLFWADTVISTIKGSQGDIKGFTQIVRDLTNIKEITEKNKAKFKDLESAVTKRTKELEKINTKLRSEILLRQRLEEELKQKADNLSEINERKNEFLAILGHELRNPLSSILSSVEYIKYDPIISGEAKEIFSTIERQTKNLERILKDLLDISRVMHGKIDLRKEETDLAEIVKNAINTAGTMIEKGKHKLTVKIPENPVIAYIDPVRIEQVVVNIVNNAAKFTPPGGKIAIALTENESCISINVKDTGIGIAQADLATIFDLFHQEKELKPFIGGGLGVGLMLAKNLAQMHGGRIEAKSAGQGKGSEFIIVFPRENILPPQAKTEYQPYGSLAGNGNGKYINHKLKILVVDDNVDAANSLGNVLNRVGYEARAVYGGKEGLDEVKRFAPDIMFVDLRMPFPDGCEVAKRLKGNSKTSKIPLVALTGYGDEDNIRKAKEAGFDYSLIKPVSIDEIRKFIDASLYTSAD